MFFYVVNLFMQFWSRKIFLEYLGTEILGLNTTAVNLLQFLNIAELGISVAVGFTLYKPLYDNDRKSINEVVALQKHLYRRIALLIIAGALVLMCFFPMIFSKMRLPLWYAYASFGALLFSSLTGYFFNYRQTLLTANQQDYKVLYSYRSVLIVKVFAQMAAVAYLEHGYVWWLVLEVIFAVIASVSLNLVTRHTFPYLENVKESYSELRKRYPEFTLKIKQLFFHKIGSFAMSQLSPLLVYAFTTLTMVTLYGNYLIIFQGLTMLLTAIFNGLCAGVGNMLVEQNKEHNQEILFELLSSQIWLGGTMCFGLWILTPDFITFWVGEEYILPSSTLWILVVTFFLNLTRYNVGAFITGFGLYRDIWAPVVETVINCSVAITLGYFWGLNGVLLGTVASTFVIIYCWQPYFVYKYGFKSSPVAYFIKSFKLTLVLASIWAVCAYISSFIKLPTGLYARMGCEIVEILVFSGLLLGVLNLYDAGTQRFLKRIQGLILNNLTKKA